MGIVNIVNLTLFCNPESILISLLISLAMETIMVIQIVVA